MAVSSPSRRWNCALCLYIRVHGFYVRELAGSSAYGDTAPTVVHEAGRVVDASDDAELRGVAPGMPLGQARALLRGARYVALDPGRFLAAQRRWLDALVPFTDALEPLSLHEAALDLSGHLRAEEGRPGVTLHLFESNIGRLYAEDREAALAGRRCRGYAKPPRARHVPHREQ